MIQLCLQENRRRHIKRSNRCCRDIKEPGQYGCEIYPNYRQKKKEDSKEKYKENSTKEDIEKKIF